LPQLGGIAHGGDYNPEQYDRDANAARNIAALGRREALNARGGQVRPAATLASAGEAGSLRGAA